MAAFTGPIESFGKHLYYPQWDKDHPLMACCYDVILLYLWSAVQTPYHVYSHAHWTANYLGGTHTPNASLELYKAESRMVFAIIVNIVRQLEDLVTLKQHDDLIHLLLAMRNIPLPKNVVKQMPANSQDMIMNKDLTCFVEVFSDFERDAPMYVLPPGNPTTSSGKSTTPQTASKPRAPWRLPPHRPLTTIEWQSLNIFLARLHTSVPDVRGLDVRGLDVRGLSTMIEALEQPLPAVHLNYVLPAASSWIIYAGERMMKYTHLPSMGYGDDEPVNRVAGVL